MKRLSAAMFILAISTLTACADPEMEQAPAPPVSDVKPAPNIKDEQPLVVQDVAALQEGTFAFADETGHRLLVDPDAAIQDEQASLIAVGQGGVVLPVQYAGSQPATEEDNGRQTAPNFSHQAGQLYEVSEGAAEPNATYFIIPKRHLPTDALMTIQPANPEEINEQELQDIKNSKGREVDKAWPIVQLPDGESLYLVQFVRQGDDMLASLALKRESGWLYYDYPAKFDPSSTWRVDDQGEVRPEMFSFLFAAKTELGFVLGVQWMGSEGENVSLLSVSDDAITDLGLAYGRYMSP
ncbi:hypothetical protein AAXB25_07075 [Paenibacillus lautus]|uniref:hypothetical protein n=1 Tax=Paenibacillus lautus TaxID=1401 RepID=UPI003D2697AE